jgi:hypothetical protein
MDLEKQPGAFRLWVQRIWYENTEEHLTYGELPYTITEYWTRYKWWLRREYRYQQQRNREQELNRSRSIWRNPQ